MFLLNHIISVSMKERVLTMSKYEFGRTLEAPSREPDVRLCVKSQDQYLRTNTDPLDATEEHASCGPSHLRASLH